MKAQEFVKLLRKVIREEVRSVVGDELRRVLNEEITTTKPSIPEQTKPKQKTMQRMQYQREYPLVSMEDIFADTRANMAGFGEDQVGPIMEETFNPELPVSSAQTATLIKDYSALLKRADEIANQSRG
jgi:hypothetical protein